MKILGLLSILFILEVRSGDLKPYITNTICLEGCKCQNKNNVTLEISNCLRPIDIKTNFNTTATSFSTISFNGVIIEKIDIDAFQMFSVLENVEFKNSEIRSMHPQAFLRDDLTTLRFSNCKFNNTPPIQCLALEELVITNANLKKTPQMKEVQSLSVLRLEGNKILDLKVETFATMESLEEVYLSNNALTSIKPNLFLFNENLDILDLSNNLLTSYFLVHTNELQVLNLSNNKLKVFDNNSTRFLKSLRSLDLSNNLLSKLDTHTFANLSLLEMVNLGYNRLTHLDDNIFKYNTVLEKIILDGNNFKTLPIFRSHTGFLQKMYNFSCKKCGIVALSSFNFVNMPGLVQINLAGNEMKALDPKAFATLGKLGILDLSGNMLVKLGANVFSDNKKLAEINLSGNPLRTLDPKDFIHLSILKKLDASNAKLRSLWADNYEYVLNELEQLTISNNSIEDITSDDLKVMPNLRYLDLDNNPIQCTRHLAHLIKWLTSHEVYSTESANLLRTNEKLLDDAAQYFEDKHDHESQWLKLAQIACAPSDNKMKNKNAAIVMNLIYSEKNDVLDDSVPKVEPPQEAPMYDDTTSEQETFDDPNAEIIKFGDFLVVKEERPFSQASNIIFVFVVTALIVLCAAVSIILVLMRRNNTLNINNANLPRIKIPRWDNIPSQKKHSGSIYRPLSEEILAPPTPKINRYDFKTNPAVHNPHI